MAAKANFYSDNSDIDFHLSRRVPFHRMYERLLPDDLTALGISSVDEYKQLWLSVLDTVGEVAGSVLAPNAQKVEKEGVRLTEDGEVALGPSLANNLKTLKDIGFPGLCMETAHGGVGSPLVTEICAFEILARACPSTLSNAIWYGHMGLVLDEIGTPEVRKLALEKIATGVWSGSMALTEPDAGSDLAALRCYGEKQADGSWRLFGSKRFITNGCGEFSLVLAKNAKGAEGLDQLNLFFVERKIDGKQNFAITKLEEKIGLHGSPTCELKFEGSHAVLLGENGEGFLHMLRLMNDARLAVGVQGLGLMEATYRLAADYASQRKTWGRPIAQHELIAEKLLDLEVEVRAFRSLIYHAASIRSLTFLNERRLHANVASDQEKAALSAESSRLNKLLRDYTPLIKWWAGERSVLHARTALQILGGYGFTTEYRAEWWVRESLILSIYEGTSQIQGLMCIKDTLKNVIRHPAEFVEVALGLRVKVIAEADPLRRKLNRAKQIVNRCVISILFRLLKENVRSTLSEAKATDILQMVRLLSRDLVKFENLSPALLHAERICEMKAYVAMAECIIADAEVEPARRWIAERFLNKALIVMTALKSEVEADEPILAHRLQDCRTTS